MRKAPRHGPCTCALGAAGCPDFGDEAGEIAIRFGKQDLSPQLGLDRLLEKFRDPEAPCLDFFVHGFWEVDLHPRHTPTCTPLTADHNRCAAITPNALPLSRGGKTTASNAARLKTWGWLLGVGEADFHAAG